MIDCALDCCCRNVWALVRSAATATPAKINVAVFERIDRPPINHVTITAPIAPAKASSGVHEGVPVPWLMSMIAKVAPSPAPEATPSR